MYYSEHVWYSRLKNDGQKKVVKVKTLFSGVQSSGSPIHVWTTYLAPNKMMWDYNDERLQGRAPRLRLSDRRHEWGCWVSPRVITVSVLITVYVGSPVYDTWHSRLQGCGARQKYSTFTSFSPVQQSNIQCSWIAGNSFNI